MAILFHEAAVFGVLWSVVAGLRRMPDNRGSQLPLGASLTPPCQLDATTEVPLCTLDPLVRPHDYVEQKVRSFKPYTIANKMPPAGVPFDPKTTAIVFAHISKSGGVTFREILGQVARQRGWGDVQVVNRRMWRQIVRDCSSAADRAVNGLCNQVLYSSTDAMGLCEFLNRPHCVYVTVLRDPVARLLSSYNYFCSLGSERKKGWQPGWTKCGWNESQWAAVMGDFLPLQFGINHAPLLRLTALESTAQCAECPMLATAPIGTPKSECLTAAKTNLASGAVFPIFLDNLTSGTDALAGRLGLPELAEVARRSKPENVHPHQAGAVELSLRSSSSALANDMDFYRYVRSMAQ